MKDFDYEVRQRKQLAQQARHKKNGSKSKKCSLPSDRLTAKQWKERNGEVMTYDLSKPMGWLQFKQLPADIQHEYINKLIAEYDASQSFFAKMFGISINTFKRYMEVIGFNHVFVQRRPTALVMQAQARFLGVVDEDTADADREEVAAPRRTSRRRCALTASRCALAARSTRRPFAIRWRR